MWLVDPTGMAVDSSYTINENTGQVITTGDRGGDDMDYIHHLAGSFTYDEVVKVRHIIKADGEIIRGEVASGPGYRVYDYGTGGAAESVYNNLAFAFMPLPKFVLAYIPIPKLGLFGKLKGALGFGAKEVVEGAAEGVEICSEKR